MLTTSSACTRSSSATPPGTRYRWRTWENNLLGEHTPALCNSLAAVVAEDILRTTQDCSDLDAGAYWGHVLEPA